MVKNRKCLSCATSYQYCPDCSRVDKLAPAWKSQFCSEDCMTLWSTLTKFGMSYLTKSEAKEIISALNLKPIDAYVACVQRDYAKVMEPERKSRKVKKFEPVVEVETVCEEAVVDPEVIIEPIVAEVEESIIHEVVKQENE